LQYLIYDYRRLLRRKVQIAVKNSVDRVDISRKTSIIDTLQQTLNAFLFLAIYAGLNTREELIHP